MSVGAGPWYIDDVLTFTVNTHRVDTGAATDADAVPPYRIYEDETGTAILTGNTAKLDDANTTGFYSEQITLSAANGFEVGKSYSIYVAATVNSVIGTQSHNFKVIATPNNALDAAGIRTAVGLASANLDTQLSTIDDFIDTEVSAIKAKTDNLPASPAAVGSAMTLTSAYDPAKTASQAGDAMTLTSGERTSVADALLNRDMSIGTDSGSTTVRTVRQALRLLRNKWTSSGGTLTAYKEDDATTSWTSALTGDAAANPVVASDPAGP